MGRTNGKAAPATRRRAKTNGKASDRGTTDAPSVEDRMEAMRADQSRRASLDVAFPFNFHTGEEVPIFGDILHTPERVSGVYELDEKAAAVCDKALDEGLRVSFPCPPDFVVEATVRIAQSLRVKCCIRYDACGERLWVWTIDPRDEREFNALDEIGTPIQARLRDLREALLDGLTGGLLR